MKKIFFIVMLLFGPANLLLAQTNDINSLKEKAMSGDADAMFSLSRAYAENGEYELSRLWLIEAANRGSQDAIIFFRTLMEDVDVTLYMGDDRESFKQLYQLAEQNDAVAMMRLGYLYETGKGVVSQNTEEALKWYRKAFAINETEALKRISVNSDASRQIIEEYAQKGNDKAILALAEYYDQCCRESFNRENIDREAASKALEYYKKVSQSGNTEAKQKMGVLAADLKKQDEMKREKAERAKADADLRRSTYKNFAGVWRCKNSYTQYKFDSNGNGWFRNGSGRAWETLGVTYKSYNCISVYDAHARHTLEISGSTMTQDNSYVYRKQ